MSITINRRDLLKLLTAGVAGGIIGSQKATAVPATTTLSPDTTRQYQGTDFSGWEVALGDSLYNCPGETEVTLADIETIHYGTHSELRANIVPRKIRAHNITFKRFIDDTAFNYIHTCGYKFRLPYLPQADTSTTVNGQTIEGGIFIWDGVTEKIDKGIAFQWVINPWASSTINTWNGTGWDAVGGMKVDTTWHEVKMVVDYRCKTTLLEIDGFSYPTRFTYTTKEWNEEVIAARLQAEIISVDIEDACNMQAMHKAEFKDWYWFWEPVGNCQTYLPMVTNDN